MELKSSGSEQSFGEGAAVRDSATGKPVMHLLPPWVWGDYLPYGKHVELFLTSGRVDHLQTMLQEIFREHGIERLCHWLELGSKRYSEWNWAKGMPVSRCLDSLGRHLLAIRNGLVDEDHVAAACCNICFIVHYIMEIAAGRLDPKWDDRFNFNLYKSPDKEEKIS